MLTLRLIQIAVVVAIAMRGVYTFFIGVREGLIRRRMSSRLHRDGRELNGTPALLQGAATAAVGIGMAGLSV